MAKTIIVVYVEDLKTHLQGAKWCKTKNDSIIKDFNFLMRVSCQNYSHAREIARYFISVIEENLPSLILNQKVIYQQLDLISMIHYQISGIYDGRSHNLKLLLSKQDSITLPDQDAIKIKTL